MKNKSLNFYDLIIMLFIVSMFAFENQTYSLLFSIIQIIFLATSALVVILRRRIVLNPFIILQIVLLGIVLIIEIVVSTHGFKGNSEIYTFFGNLIKLFCLIQYFTSEEKINKTILFTVIGGVVASSFVIFDYFSIDQIEYDLKYASNQRIGADVSGGNVNITALNLSIAFSGAIYYLYKDDRGFFKQLFCISIISLIFSAIIFTGSRKVILFCLITYLFQTALKSKIRTIWATIIIALIYMFLINIDILYFYIGHKIDLFGVSNTASIYYESDTIRKNLILEGFQLFSNNFFGVGLGGVAMVLGNYAHNNFIEILASLGIIGFILYYSTYIYPLIKFRKISISKQLFIYFFSSILGLLIIEWYQVTYLFKIPMMLLALASSYAFFKGKGNVRLVNE